MRQEQIFLYWKVLDSNNGFEHFTGSENLVERLCCCCFVFWRWVILWTQRDTCIFLYVSYSVRERERAWKTNLHGGALLLYLLS